jgi:hypothetical protein
MPFIMKKVTLTIKDERKTGFLMELLKQFDFIEVQKYDRKKESTSDYDFFASAGLWKDRNINIDQLREQAWQRSH